MEIQIGMLKIRIEADYRQHKYFYIFSPEKVSCDKMSLAPIQEWSPDSLRSRKMIEGVFTIFSQNAFFDVSKGPKTQNAKIRAGGAEVPEGPSSDIFEKSAFAPLIDCKRQNLRSSQPVQLVDMGCLQFLILTMRASVASMDSAPIHWWCTVRTKLK